MAGGAEHQDRIGFAAVGDERCPAPDQPARPRRHHQLAVHVVGVYTQG